VPELLLLLLVLLRFLLLLLNCQLPAPVLLGLQVQPLYQQQVRVGCWCQ
jgi:hypothetical protein